MYFDERTENLSAAVPVQHPELTAVQQHCLEAAEYLRSHGWIQGHWQRADNVCMMGAVSMVAEPNFNRNTLPFHEVAKHLRTLLGLSRYGWHTVVDWNDTPGRTKQEVIDLLERAAEVPPC